MTSPLAQRALHLFRLAKELPQDDEILRACLVAYQLREEGFEEHIQQGWFRQVCRPPQKPLVHEVLQDIEVLEIDDVLVDAQGVHANWEGAAQSYGFVDPSLFEWGGDPLKFNPTDTTWVGGRNEPKMRLLIAALKTAVDRQALDGSTPRPCNVPGKRRI